MKKKRVKRSLAILLSLVMVFSLTACGGEKDNNTNEQNTQSEQNTETETKKREFDLDAIGATIMMGTVTYSHGGINKSEKYPCWEMVSVNHETNEMKDMVLFDDSMYVDGDDEMIAYFGGTEAARTCTSSDHDLMYIYTVPVDANICFEIISRVFDEGGDGIKVYAYMNEESNVLVEDTLVEYKEDNSMSVSTKILDVQKGDKLYFGYNPNGTNDYDEGNFYIKITYMDVAS